jgi:transcriptional regulator of acetoin/glycerol metabolism
VRELRNTIQRAACSVAARHRRRDLGLAASSEPAPPARRGEPDRGAIEAALQRSGGVVSQAAAELGLSRQALYRRMDRFGMERRVRATIDHAPCANAFR